MFKRANLILILSFFAACYASGQVAISDPTKPLGFSGSQSGATESAQQTIQLTSILIAEDRKVAIINGQSLQENQTLKGVGALVKKIDANAVTLQQNGKLWRVALNNTVIRK